MSGRDSPLLSHPPRNPAYEFPRTGLGPSRSTGFLQSRVLSANPLFAESSSEKRVKFLSGLCRCLACGKVIVPLGMKVVGLSFESGRRGPSLSPTPLGTGLETFASSGSGHSKPWLISHSRSFTTIRLESRRGSARMP